MDERVPEGGVQRAVDDHVRRGVQDQEKVAGIKIEIVRVLGIRRGYNRAFECFREINDNNISFEIDFIIML